MKRKEKKRKEKKRKEKKRKEKKRNEAVGIGGMMMIDDDFPPMGDQSGLLPSPVQTAQPSRQGTAFPDLGAAAAPSGSEPALPTQPRQRRYAFAFHFIPYSLGCGASCHSSDTLA